MEIPAASDGRCSTSSDCAVAGTLAARGFDGSPQKIRMQATIAASGFISTVTKKQASCLVPLGSAIDVPVAEESGFTG